ncbi:hypothetical protein AAFC00_006025 [Neodothiora populina]|uniref:Replication termination factor 2 n=1 Tax=Neodothiora populina TaxID=2781224 RepID=A0ABR3P820_9PEZI
MGNDGGSIPTRRELVKEAARNPTTTELKATQLESQAHNWTHDPLNHQPLAKPVVSDSNGRLYNKDSILEFLLPSEEDGADEGARARREEKERVIRGAVRSLKDVVEVRFEVDEDETKRLDVGQSWKCPITSSRLGPATKAVYLVPCGHAFSAAAIKEVALSTTAPTKGGNCSVCDVEYAQNDVIPVLPVKEEDIARLLLRAKTLREEGLTHSLKKAARDKSSKKRKARAAHVDSASATPAAITINPEADIAPSATNIRNSSTASLTAKVMAEQEANKKRRLGNSNLNALFSSRDPTQPSGRSGDFMTRGFDIPASARR